MTILSITLDIKGRLENGLKFLGTISAFAFFRRGVTRPCLKGAGIVPDDKLRLISNVITGSSSFRQHFSISVGRGSNAHVVLGDLRMYRSISS